MNDERETRGGPEMKELQLWNVSVKAANRTEGYSIVTELGARVALAEYIAMAISEHMGPNREVNSAVRTCTVYARTWNAFVEKEDRNG